MGGIASSLAFNFFVGGIGPILLFNMSKKIVMTKFPPTNDDYRMFGGYWLNPLYSPYTVLLFMLFIVIYTYLLLLYQCKYKYEPENGEKQPDIDLNKFYIPLIPMFAWVIISFVYQKYFPFHPLFSKGIFNVFGLLIVGLFFYITTFPITYSECYNSNWLSWIVDKIKSIF